MYHRAAIGRAWWRSLLEILLAGVFWFVGASVVVAITLAATGTKKLEQLDNETTLFVALALMAGLVPSTLLAARITGRKPGFISSVAGRLRKRWLARCFLIALIVNVAWIVVFAAINVALGDHETSKTASTHIDLKFLGLVFLIVPIQSAGEEYFFRGTLMQFVGRFVRPWQVSAAVSAFAFTLVHGAPSAASITLFVMGAVFAWLTVRTGGVEAAIAQHATNNVLVFSLLALSGGSESIDAAHLNEGVTWGAVASQTVTLAVYAFFILRSYKRRPPLPQRALAETDQVQQHAPERSGGVEHADHGGDAQALAPEQQEPRG